MDEKKNNKGLKIAVAVMAVVIVALAGVVTAFLLKGDNNDRETSSAVTETRNLKPSRRLLKRRPKPGQPRLLPLFISVRRKPSAFQWAAKKAI